MREIRRGRPDWFDFTNNYSFQLWWAEKCLRTHNIPTLELNGLQQQKTISGSSASARKRNLKLHFHKPLKTAKRPGDVGPGDAVLMVWVQRPEGHRNPFVQFVSNNKHDYKGDIAMTHQIRVSDPWTTSASFSLTKGAAFYLKRPQALIWRSLEGKGLDAMLTSLRKQERMKM